MYWRGPRPALRPVSDKIVLTPQLSRSSAWSSPLLAVTLFLAGIAYVPGAVAGTYTGRWVVLTLGACLLARTAVLGVGHILGVALLVWSGITLLWAVSAWDGLGSLWQLVVAAAFFGAASNLRDLRGVSVALSLTVTVSLVFVLIQLAGYPLLTTTDIYGGLFLNKNTMGEIAVVALVLAIGYRQRWLIPASLVMVLLSQSRGAYLAVILAGWYSIRSGVCYQRAERAIADFMLVWCVIVLSAITVTFTTLLNSTMDRIHIWEAVGLNLKLFGHGLDTFGVIFPYIEYVHNEYLQVLFELGVPGLALFIGLIWYALSSRGEVYTLWAESGEKPGPTILPARCALVAWCATAFVSFPLHHPMGLVLFAILTGYLFGARTRLAGNRYQDTSSVLQRLSSADEISEPCGYGEAISSRPKYPLGG